jgi:nucleoside-diphosphate-sugar epimerase
MELPACSSRITLEAREPRTFLVTGGTGFLGSHIAARLLAEGHRMILPARGRKQCSAAQRVGWLLDWFGVPGPERQRLMVLQAHMDDPLLGLEARTAQSVAGQVNEVIHCASDTSFAARKHEQVERTNVQGLENLLEFLKSSRCRAFHLISTAYVAGKSSGLCREDLAPRPEAFHNVYEETKFRAERVAAKRCAQNRIALFVYRPSIVYGDSNTGRTLLFNALYYPIRTLHYFQKLYTRDILENGGKKARAMGVHLNGDGTLYLPVRVDSPDASGVNIVPVDHFIRAFTAIRRQAPEGGVFHIVNPRNISIARLLDYIRRFFKIDGLRIAAPDAFAQHPRNPLELLLENHIQLYSSYMRDTRIFEHAKAAAILAQQEIACPDFSYDIFSTCMRYAVAVDWGRRLNQEGDSACAMRSPTGTERYPHRKNAD